MNGYKNREVLLRTESLNLSLFFPNHYIHTIGPQPTGKGRREGGREGGRREERKEAEGIITRRCIYTVTSLTFSHMALTVPTCMLL